MKKYALSFIVMLYSGYAFCNDTIIKDFIQLENGFVAPFEETTINLVNNKEYYLIKKIKTVANVSTKVFSIPLEPKCITKTKAGCAEWKYSKTDNLLIKRESKEGDGILNNKYYKIDDKDVKKVSSSKTKSNIIQKNTELFNDMYVLALNNYDKYTKKPEYIELLTKEENVVFCSNWSAICTKFSKEPNKYCMEFSKEPTCSKYEIVQTIKKEKHHVINIKDLVKVSISKISDSCISKIDCINSKLNSDIITYFYGKQPDQIDYLKYTPEEKK